MTEVAARPAWKCSFCEKAFSSEGFFMRHRCAEREKLELLRSPTGQAAYLAYAEWMRCLKRSVPPIETFAESRKFNVFVQFARHVERVHVPNVQAFIRFMVESDVPPNLWHTDGVFSLYIKLYDDAVSPATQVAESQQLLAGLVLELNVEPERIYAEIGVVRLEELIKRRKLTFWFLLSSRNFRAYLQTLSREDQDKLTDALNAKAAVIRIQQEPELFRRFTEEAVELGL